MNDTTYLLIGILLIFFVFIFPILKDIKNYLNDLIILKKKENEMVASLHDKVMEIRNSINVFERKNKKI